MIDPENPVVKLCADGMRAEGEGKMNDARDLFLEAWRMAQDDFEACIAAHYVARHQESPGQTLHWNQLSLDRANAVGDERVSGFYPSLYLNMGHSCEQLGDIVQARRYYDLADEHARALPDGRYGAIVQGGIDEARKRLDAAQNAVPNPPSPGA